MQVSTHQRHLRFQSSFEKSYRNKRPSHKYQLKRYIQTQLKGNASDKSDLAQSASDVQVGGVGPSDCQLLDRIRQLEGQNVKLARDNANLEEVASKTSQLAQIFRELEEKNTRSTKDNNGMKESTSHLAGQLHEHKLKNEGLAKENVDLKESISRLRGQLQAAELAKLRVDALNAEFAQTGLDLNQQIGGLQVENVGLKESIGRLRGQSQATELAKLRVDARNAEFAQTVHDLKQQIEGLQVEKADLNATVTTTSKAMQNLVKNVHKARTTALKCAICLAFTPSPYCLAGCGHSFCGGCLKSFFTLTLERNIKSQSEAVTHFNTLREVMTVGEWDGNRVPNNREEFEDMMRVYSDIQDVYISAYIHDAGGRAKSGDAIVHSRRAFQNLLTDFARRSRFLPDNMFHYNCPLCRSKVTQKPVVDVVLRELLDTLGNLVLAATETKPEEGADEDGHAVRAGTETKPEEGDDEDDSAEQEGTEIKPGAWADENPSVRAGTALDGLFPS